MVGNARTYFISDQFHILMIFKILKQDNLFLNSEIYWLSIQQYEGVALPERLFVILGHGRACSHYVIPEGQGYITLPHGETGCAIFIYW